MLDPLTQSPAPSSHLCRVTSAASACGSKCVDFQLPQRGTSTLQCLAPGRGISQPKGSGRHRAEKNLPEGMGGWAASGCSTHLLLPRCRRSPRWSPTSGRDPGQQEAACDAPGWGWAAGPPGALTPGRDSGFSSCVWSSSQRRGPGSPGATHQAGGGALGSVPGGLCGQNLVRPE